jgi:hypothetical protein
MTKQFLFMLMSVLLLCGCAEDKYDLNSLPVVSASSNSVLGDTVYVKQNPDESGFNNPQAVIVGNEPLVYVADTYNNRIVMLDIAGRVIGYSQYIQRPVALAEDKRMQLLVCAEFDTLVQGQKTTFGAVYRLNLPAVGHNIAMATPRRVIWDTTLGNYASRRYTCVAPLLDDYYYIGRTGDKNTGTYDPDDAIILYSKDDKIVTPVSSNFAQLGTGLLSMHKITALATMPTGNSIEFVFGQIPATSVIPLWKVQWIQYLAMGQTANWVSKFYPSTDGDVDILKTNRFIEPRGLALDPSGNLFVVDAATDSLYRFSARGIEHYSFGGSNDPYGRNFNQPYSVAYYDKTLFIADKGNNRICRYKLSIDMN